MKRAFTLLELVVVIIIIGVLATLGLTQYGRIIERSRGAEARAISGDIRKYAAAYFMENNTLVGITPLLVNIGTAADRIPGTTAADCRPSHYFWYTAAGAGSTITITATRCIAGGKVPNAAVADTLTLTSNFATGVDTWAGTGGY